MADDGCRVDLPRAAASCMDSPETFERLKCRSSMSDVPVGMSMKPPTCTVAVMCKIGKVGRCGMGFQDLDLY